MVMIRRASALLAFVAAISTGTHCAAPAAAATRVLFIGNSYTYVNELPRIVERIAKSKGLALRTDMVASGGATLRNLWDGGDAEKAFRRARFDYVVIQPQSSEILRMPDETKTYAKKFADAVRETGAQPIFFAPWHPAEFDASRDRFRTGYRSLAEEDRIRLAPVDDAWKNALSAGIALYDSDGSHPNPAGSYAAACVFFAMVFDRNPADAAHPDLAGHDAALLQRAAWDAVRNEPLAKR
jgi:hypothetical protein